MSENIAAAVEYVRNHYQNSIQLGDIAARAYLSMYHFSRQFKKETGVSPHSYLMQVRLERARELLETTQIPVIKIAEEVGYAESFAFHKAFKKQYNLPPGKYRKMRQG